MPRNHAIPSQKEQLEASENRGFWTRLVRSKAGRTLAGVVAVAALSGAVSSEANAAVAEKKSNKPKPILIQDKPEEPLTSLDMGELTFENYVNGINQRSWKFIKYYALDEKGEEASEFKEMINDAEAQFFASGSPAGSAQLLSVEEVPESYVDTDNERRGTYVGTVAFTNYDPEREGYVTTVSEITEDFVWKEKSFDKYGKKIGWALDDASRTISVVNLPAEEEFQQFSD